MIATARASDWHSEPEKITLRWLEENGLCYNKIYIGRNDKEKICEEENADFFVDDDAKIVGNVVNLFTKSKTKQAFYMTTNYNQNLPVPAGAKRIKSVTEIVEFFEKSQNKKLKK